MSSTWTRSDLSRSHERHEHRHARRIRAIGVLPELFAKEALLESRLEIPAESHRGGAGDRHRRCFGEGRCEARQDDPGIDGMTDEAIWARVDDMVALLLRD